MKKLIATVVLCSVLMGLFPMLGNAADVTYEGTWNTTNRKLDGLMTCIVTDLGDEKWKGRFFGVWQGVAFDYTVAVKGPAADLTATPVIDGADYSWNGRL